ncbi:MAG: type VI secretion system baseplate subunit TssE [Phycisphaerae bacterium]
MAELTPSERLQPCLLDRLVDDQPDSKVESRDQRVVSMRRYRDGVLRDLNWLLNTGCRSSEDHLEDYPEVARSVLNYGTPDLCGQTASGVSPEQIERNVIKAIQAFEPRIIRNSLSIRPAVEQNAMSHNAVFLEIRGELWALPAPEVLYVKTQVDLETGQCELKGG